MNGALAGGVHARYGVLRHTVRRRVAPLRMVFWGLSAIVGLAIASEAVWSIAHGGGDWRVFVAAGSAVGTHALVEPSEAWRIFLYPPAAAWPLALFAHVPLAESFVLNALLMLACAAVAGAVASRLYGLGNVAGPAAYVLWTPVVYASAIIGQNAPLGLLLCQLAIVGLAMRSVVLTAVPIGLLLYKPTYALPLIALLLVRSRMRELGIVAAIAALWYVLSVAATGGEWNWPLDTLRLLVRYAGGDFAVNRALAVSLPGLLMRAGVTPSLVVGATIAVTACVLVALRRAGAAEAGSAACLAGIALSPHAWAYDAALAAPMIAFVAARVEEPARTCWLIALAVVAPLFFFSPLLGFNPLALVVVGGTFAWIVLRLTRGAVPD